jgi:outer membrane protein assembly factor BamB
MKSLYTNREHTVSFTIVSLMLAIAPLWLMLAAANTHANAQTSSSADWTQFHRDNMQRWNPYETVLGVSNAGTLELKWSFNIGSGSSLGTSSSPAVANGVIYVGSDDGNVYALNATTHAKLWSFTTGGQVVSSPAVANGVVYIGSVDGNLYALNASTGAKLWSFATGNEVLCSPAVVNGVVYIGPDSGDGKLYALNATTGAELWSSAADFFFLTRSGEWGGLCRLERRQRVHTECQHGRRVVEL